MSGDESWLRRELAARGLSRRDFVGFCAGVAAMLGLPRSAGARIAKALSTKPKPTLVWLEFQDCAADTESFLRASHPTAAEVILDLLSIDYHETIMAASGQRAHQALDKVVESRPGEYIVVVEGSIPLGADGGYCTIGGRSAQQMARAVCKDAAAVIAVGTCAAYGGLPAAAPNPTQAVSVAEAVPGIKNLINMPACPVNAENLIALIVYYLTFDRWPPLDRLGRPLFAYGKSIHDNCERRAHFDAGQYVEMWGDEAHREGHCLYKMGCKGPATFHNCPNVRWNEGENWPIGCGHPCIGCAEPEFWDRMTPFYRHLPGIPGFNDATGIDRVGLYAAAAVTAGFGGHTLVQLGKRTLDKQRAGRAGRTTATPPAEPPASGASPAATPRAPDQAKKGEP